jgi:hypothetical protein
MNTCGGCGEDSLSLSHACDLCSRKNHPFCGIVVGEGHGGAVRCVGCLVLPTPTKKKRRSAASPIIEAFARAAGRTRLRNTQHHSEGKQEEGLHGEKKLYFGMEYIALQQVNCDTYMQVGYRPPRAAACQ